MISERYVAKGMMPYALRSSRLNQVYLQLKLMKIQRSLLVDKTKICDIIPFGKTKQGGRAISSAGRATDS